MSTTTEDPRFQKIKSEQVYGLYHDGSLIYVGCTTNPLERRKNTHRQRARDGVGSPIYTYIREEVDDPRDSLTIEVIPYDSEADALDHLQDEVLNVDPATEADYRGHEWTTKELDVLEECDSIQEAQEKLGLSQTQVRNAMLKLGMIEHTRFEEWTDEEIDLLGTATDKSVAAQIGRTRAAVQQKRHQLGIDAGGRPGSQSLSPGEAVLAYVEYQMHGSLSYTDIADALGVSRCVVGRICRGESYEDIPREALDNEIEEIRPALDLSATDSTAALYDEELRADLQ